MVKVLNIVSDIGWSWYISAIKYQVWRYLIRIIPLISADIVNINCDIDNIDAKNYWPILIVLILRFWTMVLEP